MPHEASPASHVEDFNLGSLLSEYLLGELSALEGIVIANGQVDVLVVRAELIVVLRDLILSEVSMLKHLFLQFLRDSTAYSS